MIWKAAMGGYQMTRASSVCGSSYVFLTTILTGPIGDQAQQQEALQLDKEHGTDVMHYWDKIHPKLPAVIAYHAAPMTDSMKAKAIERYNPYQGIESARQLDEPVADFLKRLPPLESAPVDHWLWCANPFAEAKDQPEQRSEKGIQLAARLLQAYDKKKADIKAVVPDISAAALTKNLANDRDKLKEGLLNCAKQYGMACGKVNVE